MFVIPGRAEREPGNHNHRLSEEALRPVWECQRIWIPDLPLRGNPE
jgi:hypothetical protein